MLKLNRAVFFAGVRNGPFRGKLTQSQVAGMNDLLDVWEQHGTDDPRHLAYSFATDYHETGGKMQPVREGFSTSDKAARAFVQRVYGHKGPKWYSWPVVPGGPVYYGRGDVQLTWYDNYLTMGRLLDLPLVDQPDLALNSMVSKRILVEGMLRGVSSKGDFTGKALEDYFNDRTDDPVGARRVVNGTDRAALIGGYHAAFLHDIEVARAAYLAEPDLPVQAEPVPSSLPKATDETSWGAVIQTVGGAAAAAPAIFDGLPRWVALAALAVVAVGLVIVANGRRKLVQETGQ